MFCRLFLCTFSFGHCVVCPSSINGFWLPNWYLQTRFTLNNNQSISLENSDHYYIFDIDIRFKWRSTPPPTGRRWTSMWYWFDAVRISVRESRTWRWWCQGSSILRSRKGKCIKFFLIDFLETFIDSNQYLE